MGTADDFYYEDDVLEGQMKPGYIILIVWMFIFYIFYLVEARCCETYRFIYTQKNMVKMSEYVESIVTGAPSIKEHASCFHTETRTRTVSSTVNGRTQLRTETYTVTVTKHSDHFDIDYDNCEHAKLISLVSTLLLKFK